MGGGLSFSLVFYFRVCRLSDVPLHRTMKCFFWRALQGAVATAGAISRAIVGDIFPPQRSASVLGYIAMGISVAPILGPILGGIRREILG